MADIESSNQSRERDNAEDFNKPSSKNVYKPSSRDVVLIEQPDQSEVIPWKAKASWEQERRSQSIFALISLLLICSALAVFFHFLSKTIHGFLNLAPYILGGVGSGLFLWLMLNWAKRFFLLIRDISEAQPLLTWEAFSNDPQNLFGRMIRKALNSHDIAYYEDKPDSFNSYVRREFSMIAIGKGKKILRESFGKEWYRFKLGISQYQEEIEAAIRAGLPLSTNIWSKLFGILQEKCHQVEVFKNDERLFFELMDAYFFQMVRQYNQKHSVQQEFDAMFYDESSPCGADQPQAKVMLSSEIEDLIEAECYAFFRYNQGEYAFLMHNYFEDHPEMEINEQNFRKVLRENFLLFQRKKRLLEEMDTRYARQLKDRVLPGLMARQRKKARPERKSP